MSMSARVLFAAALLAAASAEAQQAAPERKYQVLRFDEDWGFLESKPPATPDPFDSVKHVRLSDAWTFLLGGSLRFRVEADDGKTLGTGETSDTQARARAFLHWELRHRKDFRFFAEIGASDTFATDRRVPGLMEDSPDVQNFFLEGTFGSKGTTPVTIRAGRQELLFGAQRLVSPLDWSNSRRAWDGLSVIASSKRSKTTIFATRYTVNEEHSIDSPSDDVSFSGVATSFRPKEGHVVEGYGFLLHDSSGRHVSETSATRGDIDRQTFGARWGWTSGAWTGDVEAALQRGDASDDDISAFMLSATAWHQWKKADMKPRLGFGIDHASGDDDPLDGDVGTFEAPYPLGHAWLGHVDLVGRKNIQSARVQADFAPARGWKVEAALHAFRLAEARDALYEAGNSVLRKDPTGAAGKDVGTELDVAATWTFRTHHALGMEVARFWTGDFMERTGGGDDFWWGWIGYELKF